jgi:hypothetical protein
MNGIENAMDSFSASVIDRMMKAIWAAAMWLLRTAFELTDSIGGFRDGSSLVDDAGRPSPAAPFFALWPTLVWIGGAAAVGLFLWQLALTMVRGGTGFWRVASGPAAYCLATALTLGVVAALVGAAEGITVVLLQRGLAAENFRTILDHPNLGFSDTPALDSSMDATARALLMGMIAIFGLLPAAIGFLLQMIFRQAVIIILIATVPITAAGLMANTTAVWFWRSVRWTLAAILMKPALALVLVVGVNMLSGPTGVGGLLAGAGVLLISLFCPLVLFRLLAFVEHGNRYAGAARAAPTTGGPPFGDSADFHAEQINPEQTNTARFDAAVHNAAAAGPRRPDPTVAGHRSATAAPARSARVRPTDEGTAADGKSAAGDAATGRTEVGRIPATRGTPAELAAASPRLGAAPPAATRSPVAHPPVAPRAGAPASSGPDRSGPAVGRPKPGGPGGSGSHGAVQIGAVRIGAVRISAARGVAHGAPSSAGAASPGPTVLDATSGPGGRPRPDVRAEGEPR